MGFTLAFGIYIATEIEPRRYMVNYWWTPITMILSPAIVMGAFG